MDKNRKQTYQNILNHKLLEENIPKFLKFMVNDYHTFASVRLSMHYYAFYEAYCDEEQLWSEAAKDTIVKLNQVIAENILKKQNGAALEDAVHVVDRLRNDIMKRMKILTSYSDIFQVYEYLLNRIEYQFNDPIETVDDEEFAREVLNYIFDTEDNVIINEKIREVIGQLPIRITKQKYFDLMKSSIKEYVGASQDTLDTYLYMIRTSAMLNLDPDMESLYPKLWEKKEVLEHLDYKNISKSLYEEALQGIKQSALALEAETYVYYSLQEIINEVYAILLCTPYTGIDVSRNEKLEHAVYSIILGINEEFYRNGKADPPAELLMHFSELEGVQEELGFDLTALEEVLYQVDQEHRTLAAGIMAEKLLNVLVLTRDLLSNSIFIDFYEIRSNAILGEEKITTEANKLVEELSDFFNNHDRMINRAVIANTITKMPVFFKNHKEVMDYVLYSLQKCNDQSEKTACFEIISDMMYD